MKKPKYFEFEPVRTLAALGALGVAVQMLLSVMFDWGKDVAMLVQGCWAALMTFLASFTVRDAVTANPTVDKLVDEALNTPVPKPAKK